MMRPPQRSPLFPYTPLSQSLGIEPKPVLIAPLSFLLLGKTEQEFDRLELIEPLAAVYAQVLEELGLLGAEWVQIDEPVLVMDRTPAVLAALERAYHLFGETGGLEQLLITYFHHQSESYPFYALIAVISL